MGIPKFFSWFRNYHGTKGFVKYKGYNMQLVCDVLAIDLNGFIYTNNGDFEGIWKDISKLVSEVRPREKLILAIDGVAPVAKMQQQRTRRFMNTESASSSFDTNQISPGTNYMVRLDEFLYKRVVESTNQGNFPELIVYSSHLDPGEGEHKIVKLLKGTSHEDKTLFVHGADADLILIYTLLLKYAFKDIYIYREALFKDRIMVNLIDLKGLDDWLTRTFKSEFPSDDFLVLMTMIGNDFLPHFPTLEHIPRVLTSLVETYARWSVNTRKYLCGCARIRWDNFFAFFDHFINTSYKEIYDAWRFNTPLPNERDVPFDRPSEVQLLAKEDKKYTKEWYSHALTSKAGYQVTKKQIVNMCVSYLQGIQWVYYYYVIGEQSINKNWYYPYRYTPLLEHVISVGKQLSQNKQLWEQPVVSLLEEYRSTHDQLAMILPPTSIAIVPIELQPLYAINSPIKDLHPVKFPIDDRGKNRIDYAKIPFIPFADPDRISRCIDFMGIRRLPNQEAFVSFKIVQKDARQYGQNKHFTPYKQPGSGLRFQTKKKHRKEPKSKPVAKTLFR